MVFLLVILIAAVGLYVDSFKSRQLSKHKMQSPTSHSQSNNQNETHLYSPNFQKQQSAVLI